MVARKKKGRRFTRIASTRLVSLAALKDAEEARRAETRARKLIQNAVVSSAGRDPGRVPGGAPRIRVYLNGENLYDVMHAVLTQVLVGIQKRKTVAPYLADAARAAARAIRRAAK